MRGDEKIRWMESKEGYSLLYDENRYIVYAMLDEKKNMIPSPIIVRDIDLRFSAEKEELEKIPKKLFYSKEQVNTFLQLWEIKENATRLKSTNLRSTKGTAYAICALIEFPDKPLIHTRQEFEQLMNQVGYNLNGAIGSVRDFYYENSYSQLELIIHIAGPYKAKNNRTYYGQNVQPSNKDRNVQELAKEAAKLTFEDKTIDPSLYDNDNDGYIDTFHFIYAGYGEESGGGSDCIWAHKSNLNPSSIFSGKKLNMYSCSPELRENKNANPEQLITHIGVICHELCHIFGSPDFYDTGPGNYIGTGQWDLMAMGSWNGPSGKRGAGPAHINMYQKIQFAWVDPVILSSPVSVTGIKNSAFYPEAYIFYTATENEYFVLENRQKIGFDSYLPGTGLLIYRVSATGSDIRNNKINDRHPQKVYPVCASSAYRLPTENANSYGNINSAGCAFPGSKKIREFTDQTIPSAVSWSGIETRKPLTNIKEHNNLISFVFKQSYSPLNLTATTEENRVTLYWDSPVDNNPIKGYNIYRDKQFVQYKTTTGYRESVDKSGNYTYGVSVVYDDDFESDLAEIDINVSITSISEINREQIDRNALFYLYNLQGQRIASGKAEDLFSIFPNKGNLPKGIYILQIINQGKKLNYKWIIN